MDRGELEGLDRETLVVRAQAAGIRRARILTRPELIDELLRLDPSTDEGQLRRSRGFFGRARDLVARVVERGLHLPDAADRIRELTGAELPYAAPRIEPQAMPTVTLAEIYAAQGHQKRAIETLRRVLEREPDHVAAQMLLARLEDEGYVAPPPPLPPEPEIEIDLNAAGDEEEDEESRAVTLEPPSHEWALAEAQTIETSTVGSHPFAGFAGPSYDDTGGAELHLAPESARDAPAERAYAIVAAQDKDVDALAATGVVAVIAEVEEEDDCIAIPLSSGRMYVRWRVSFSAIGAQLGAAPQGRFVVRAHVVTPQWDGPHCETRDRRVDPEEDEAVLDGLPENAVVRVAVGWLDGGAFVPFAHSPALERASARGLSKWTPRGPVPIALDDPRAAPIARALDRSRIAEARG